jgi:YHS domain-containing protein
MRNIARTFLLLTAFLLFWPPAAGAEADPVNTTLLGGLAVDGYDPVAYFTEGKPVEGKKEHSFEWEGATWRFASAANRDLFAAAPEKYAPQYGGYCAWAVSQGYTADADPEAWKIVDGKLYLNYDKKVQAKWETDIPGLIKKGDENWPKLHSGG